MKRFLLISSIFLIVIGVLCLCYGALNMFGYYNVLDGSSSLYSRLHRNMKVFLTLGAVLPAIGIIILAIRSKIS